MRFFATPPGNWLLAQQVHLRQAPRVAVPSRSCSASQHVSHLLMHLSIILKSYALEHWTFVRAGSVMYRFDTNGYWKDPNRLACPLTLLYRV
jgi:hypothetical protein